MGLRERGKAERLQRLHAAALQVFREKGFDAATTREIALVADVSVGTLFTYAHDKRDLLFMLLNDDLDAVLHDALAMAQRPAPLLDQLLTLLAPIYTYFASDPKLARAMLKEVAYSDAMTLGMGEQALRYLRRLDGWLDGIRLVLERGKITGHVDADAATPQWAQILWSLHLVEVRRWIDSGRPVAAEGQARLRDLYALVLERSPVVATTRPSAAARPPARGRSGAATPASPDRGPRP